MASDGVRQAQCRRVQRERAAHAAAAVAHVAEQWAARVGQRLPHLVLLAAERAGGEQRAAIGHVQRAPLDDAFAARRRPRAVHGAPALARLDRRPAAPRHTDHAQVVLDDAAGGEGGAEPAGGAVRARKQEAPRGALVKPVHRKCQRAAAVRATRHPARRELGSGGQARRVGLREQAGRLVDA